MIDFRIVQDLKEFNSLKNTWNDFVIKHFPDTYHLDHDWIEKWWQCYASDANVFVFFAYKGGELKGLIPLFIKKDNYGGFPVRRLAILGTGYACEDFPVISDKEEILSSLFIALKNIAQWDVAIFLRLTQDYWTLLKHALPSKACFEEKEILNPIIELKGSYSDYFNSRSHNFRANFRKKTKRINAWGKVHIRHNEIDSLDAIVKTMEGIGCESWQGQDGVNLVATESGRRFLKLMVDNFYKRRILDVTFIELNDKPIAYLLGAKLPNTYYAIETAYLQEYFDASPGMLLHLSVIEQRFNENSGISILDFGYDASYKRRWTDLNRPEVMLTIYNRGLYSKLVRFVRKSYLYSKLVAIKTN